MYFDAYCVPSIHIGVNRCRSIAPFHFGHRTHLATFAQSEGGGRGMRSAISLFVKADGVLVIHDAVSFGQQRSGISL